MVHKEKLCVLLNDDYALCIGTYTYRSLVLSEALQVFCRQVIKLFSVTCSKTQFQFIAI